MCLSRKLDGKIDKMLVLREEYLVYIFYTTLCPQAVSSIPFVAEAHQQLDSAGKFRQESGFISSYNSTPKIQFGPNFQSNPVNLGNDSDQNLRLYWRHPQGSILCQPLEYSGGISLDGATHRFSPCHMTGTSPRSEEWMQDLIRRQEEKRKQLEDRIIDYTALITNPGTASFLQQ